MGHHSGKGATTAVGGVSTAAAGGIIGALRSLVKRNVSEKRTSTQSDLIYTQYGGPNDFYGPASFVGVTVSNEVLFREDTTATELEDVITGVKSNLTSREITLPVASSDLEEKWSTSLN